MTLSILRKLLAIPVFGLVVAATPGTANAGGSVHLHVPGFSIGYYDDHYHRKHRKRLYKRYNHRHYRNHYYYNDDYYPRRSYRSYNGYRNYYRPRYQDRYYEVCPTPGYSTRYYRGRGCYSHGDHYHCDD